MLYNLNLFCLILFSLLNRVGEVHDSSGVNYRNFFYEFGVDLEPKDSEGVSTEIYVNNQIDLAMHANDQENRLEMNETQTGINYNH